MDTTVLVIIILSVVLVLAIGGFLVLRGRTKVDDSFYHFRCTKCRRRLRYQSRQVGHKGKCSNCGSEVVFPPVSQSID